MKVYRFLYHSRAFGREDVPASGVVILPYGDPPEGGWPVIAWAHGTTGVGRVAAPSLDSHLVYGWEGLLIWPTMGYAVVATDYAGLGSNVPHQYLVGASQANDVINGLKAARAAIPELGRKWVAVGHSQGARAVIEVALMENDIRDPGYLGAVSLAPGGGDPGQFLDALQETPYRGYLAFVAFGAKASFPDFEYDEVLTPDAAARMPVAEKFGLDGHHGDLRLGSAAGKDAQGKTGGRARPSTVTPPCRSWSISPPGSRSCSSRAGRTTLRCRRRSRPR